MMLIAHGAHYVKHPALNTPVFVPLAIESVKGHRGVTRRDLQGGILWPDSLVMSTVDLETRAWRWL